MKAGLYDILRGTFYGGQRVAAVPERDHRFLSVMSNLNRLFNTRQGAIEHLPDYGLPDVSSIYHGTIFAIDELRQAVKEVLNKYEPRLRKIYVEHRMTEAQDMRLTFVISAEMDTGERVKFQTTFGANDLIQVSRWTRHD